MTKLEALFHRVSHEFTGACCLSVFGKFGDVYGKYARHWLDHEACFSKINGKCALAHVCHFLTLPQEEALEGKYLIQAEGCDVSAVEGVQVYKEPSEVERAFRQLKDVIDLRPIYHQTDRRLEAHLFVAALAFLLDRALEKKLKGAGLDLSSKEAWQIHLLLMNFYSRKWRCNHCLIERKSPVNDVYHQSRSPRPFAPDRRTSTELAAMLSRQQLKAPSLRAGRVSSRKRDTPARQRPTGRSKKARIVAKIAETRCIAS